VVEEGFECIWVRQWRVQRTHERFQLQGRKAEARAIDEQGLSALDARFDHEGRDGRPQDLRRTIDERFLSWIDSET